MVLVAEIDPVANAPYCEIPLTQGFVAKVDPERFADLHRHKWSIKPSFCRRYAIRKYRRIGRQFFVLMHRYIAQTPVGMVCHHINGDSLDNRIENLQNMSDFDHIKRHSWR